MDLLSCTAEERYAGLMERNPQLIQNIFWQLLNVEFRSINYSSSTMKPFYLLLAVFMLSTGISKLTTGSWNPSFAGNLAMSVMFCFTALGHFFFVKGMTLMVPASVPFKKELVYLTGIAEIILGLALLLPSIRYYTGILLIVFLI